MFIIFILQFCVKYWLRHEARKNICSKEMRVMPVRMKHMSRGKTRRGCGHVLEQPACGGRG